MKQLVLNKETIRNLEEKTLAEVHGGGRSTDLCVTVKGANCARTFDCVSFFCL